jgi:hypothetical protein
MIIRIPPVAEILDRWHDIEPLLRRSTVRTHGCYEPEDALALLFTNPARMLLIEEEDRLLVVVVTVVRNFPRKRVLDAAFIGGALDNPVSIRQWVPLLVGNLEEMARECGATMLTGCGRIGWARAGGFKIAGGFVTREVESKGSP